MPVYTIKDMDILGINVHYSHARLFDVLLMFYISALIHFLILLY